MFDSGIDLDADLLLVLLEALKLDRELILTGNETGETVSAFEISDRLELFVAESLAAEIHDHAGQRSSLIGYVGDDLSSDATALRRTDGKNKKGD